MSGRSVISEQKDWETFDIGGNLIGDSLAPIRIVFFSDFECPYCRTMSARLLEAQQQSAGAIRIRHRHWPLTSIHRHAYDFAIASECAAQQARFAEASKELFALAAAGGSIVVADSAARLGVPDKAAFRACLADSSAAKRVEVDVIAAGRLRAQGTPVILIGEMRVDGSIAEARLDSLLAIAKGTHAAIR